uniref:Growth arrest specific 2 like 1 n=1 Tax=Petromyzon marinus TaxID=7757 RepID=S4REC0_PETMA
MAEVDISSAATKSIRPFRSSEEYLYAMKEDLAEWLSALHSLDITVDNFLEELETGTVLCHHANTVNRQAAEFAEAQPQAAATMQVNTVCYQRFVFSDSGPLFKSGRRPPPPPPRPSSPQTQPMLATLNGRATVGSAVTSTRRTKYGGLMSLWGFVGMSILEMNATALCKSCLYARVDVWVCASVQSTSTRGPLPRPSHLREGVRFLLSRCTCPVQFPMVRVSEGKYRVGDSSSLIYVVARGQILRKHVMVRVGGGWDTLEHYLDKHDPCRCLAPSESLP